MKKISKLFLSERASVFTRLFIIASTCISLYVTFLVFNTLKHNNHTFTSVLQTQKIQLLGKKDIVRAELRVDKHDAVVLHMFDETGTTILLEARASRFGSTINLADQYNAGRLSLFISDDGQTTISLKSPNGDLNLGD